MSVAFTKLFASITESTVWCEPHPTRIVWIAMLVMADQYGRVSGSVPGLANRARVTVDEARNAIASFLAPDPDSRTKDYDGRRIEEIDGGWRLLNYGKYRELRHQDDRKEQNRLAAKRYRDRARASSVASSNISTGQPNQPRSAQAEAEEEISKAAPSHPAKGEGRFPEFWATWPKSDRKMDRKKCLAKWRLGKLDGRANEILAHLRTIKTSRKWLEGYEPAPLRYLNGEQWKDELTTDRRDDIYAGAI